jgi:hypothetical protein
VVLIGGGENGVVVNPTVGQWFSFDIDMSNYAGRTLNNIIQMMFRNTTPAGGIVYVDNIYYWRPATGTTFYADADGDGYGAGSAVLFDPATVGVPTGYSANNTDCDDTDATKNAFVTTTTTTSACDTYTWSVNNQSYTASGNFSVTTACGTEYLELTINNSTSNTTTASACNSYTWSGPLGNGQTYTTCQSGVTNTSTNAAGCTHTETLNLTINGITAQPVGPKLCTTAGSTASVSVTTNVTSPLYTWQFRVVTATSTGAWTTITSANAGTVYTNIASSTLGITRTTLPAVGTQYRVLISNSSC